MINLLAFPDLAQCGGDQSLCSYNKLHNIACYRISRDNEFNFFWKHIAIK